MANTGTLYPGTVTTAAVLPYDDEAWADPTFIYADDTNYASVTASTFDTGDYSELMYPRQYGANVPAEGTITGVLVEVGKYYAVGNAQDGVVQLINGAGTPIGNSLGSSDVWPTTEPGTISYGGSANLWGAALTPAIVNGAGFGIQFAAYAAGNNCDAFVDFIRMVIYYNAPETQWEITPAEATQAQVSDAVAVAAITPITPAESTQAQVSDAAVAIAIYTLTPAEATQAQTSDLADVLFSGVAANPPQTPVLDSFNRADENPISGWGNVFAGDQGAWQIVSNQAVPVA